MSGMIMRDSVRGIERYLERWKLRDPVLVTETPTARIFKVVRKRGGDAALKVLLRGADDGEKNAAEMLAYYEGLGAAEVYGFSDNALLMEWLSGPPLQHLVALGKDEDATEIIAQLVLQLHRVRETVPTFLVPLERWFEDLFRADRSLWPFAAGDLLIRAQLVARGLLNSSESEVPLHGDLHHLNIHFSARSWLAIDAKGLLGDPAYEVANAFINPMSDPGVCVRPARISGMADHFAQSLGLDRVRILGFAVAHAALSACWARAAGEPIAHQVAILPNLIAAHEQAGGKMA